MKPIKAFSVAQRINVFILGETSKNTKDFIDKIYENFENPLEQACFTLYVKITDEIPDIEKDYELGKDGYFNENTLVLNTGHFFIRNDKTTLTVGVPTRVTRGRIPFKRITPGRHISDEIIEPLLQLALLECDATFVHASAVYENGKANVLMGWRGTGKTNAILKGFESKEIWSDDLAIIDINGFVYPYLRPIRIYSYNIPLLSPEYITKHNLNLKKRITPSWRPVHYLPLKPAAESEKRAVLGEFIYLNNKQSDNLAEDAENIMAFEQIFFNHYKIMLDQSSVFRVKNKVRKIINKALKIN